MANVIHRDTIIDFLHQDGNIIYLISPGDLQLMRKLLFPNKLSWGKITSLPEFVFEEFNKKMREECSVKVEHVRAGDSPIPIVFTKGRKVSIQIDSDKSTRGLLEYRRCLAVVAYYVALRGRVIKPREEDTSIILSDEDWLLISIATRYCLMPPKFLRKIFTITKLNVEHGDIADSRPLYHSFLDNLAAQTEVPRWVVSHRLYEHAFSDSEFKEIISKKTIDQLIDGYREYEPFKAELV